ncbi:MAG TPA: TonB-dependent receptor [Steroidobacteraceae bacterium]|nr:TonB-dependent receptor [Steroidobacteraceae bacterium]
MKRIATPFLIATGCLAGFPASTTVAAEEELSPVVVSATRLRSVSDLDAPASISTVHLDADNNLMQSNVTELLAGIPGVTALDRQNYAQDTQLSIRGFGSRSTFGVRGLRLYADGIPASMPDGQGQLSHFSVLGADSMQVMRGPFSALHGNSSGGVVQIWSRAGTPEPSARLRGTWGSNDTSTLSGQALGTTGPLDYNLAASRFETDGYRDHAAARRDSANLRLGVDLGPDQSLTLVANFVDIPEAQDPLGVTPDAWRADPRGTADVATQFNTRKSVEQLQGGAVYEHRFNAHTVRAMVYTGNREVTQYLSIPPGTQRATQTHAGGVVDLDGSYEGADLRWSYLGSLAGRALEITFGTNLDRQNQLRRGYENFLGPVDNTCSGATTCGVRGALRRDETNRIRNFDQYAQGYLHFSDRWSAMAGVRHSEVRFRNIDRYVSGTNGDDSGTRKFSDTTLVGGVVFRPTSEWRIYASLGDGFETPTFNEISYRSDGGSGLALGLQGARSRNYELGTKWRPGAGLEVDAALFRADTDNELLVARNSGGRSSFRNADGRTRRQGFETSLLARLPQGLSLEGSYTLLDAEFLSDNAICSGTPCTTPNVTVPAGSRIPGVARHQGTLALRWSPGPWQAGLEFEARGDMVVNDIDAFRAPGFGLWHAEIGRNWDLGGSSLRTFARVENLLDKTYVGSIIVNEGNSRFFEAGPERTAMIGLQWNWR